jgi:hypothetical protein
MQTQTRDDGTLKPTPVNGHRAYSAKVEDYRAAELDKTTTMADEKESKCATCLSAAARWITVTWDLITPMLRSIRTAVGGTLIDRCLVLRSAQSVWKTLEQTMLHL